MHRSLVGFWLAYAAATGEAVGVFMAVLTTVRALTLPTTGAGGQGG